MMMIKNSGYVPNTVPNPYSGKRLEQTTGVQNKSNAVKLNQVSVPPKVDTIEISQRPAPNRTSLSQTRDQIISDLNQDKDISFLETLKSKISSNQYQVDSAEMAKIMLSGNKE